MKIIGFIFILVGVSGFLTYPERTISELGLAVVLIMWGALFTQYKKYFVRKDVFIGSRSLDNGRIFMGAILIGFAIFHSFTLLEKGLPDAEGNTGSHVILLITFYIGGIILIIKGYKRYLAKKKIDSENPDDKYVRERYE